MIKEALQFVLNLGTPYREQIDEVQYSDRKLHLIEPPTASPLTTNTLQGVVDFLNAEEITTDLGFFLHVVDPGRVDVVSRIHAKYRHRETVLTAQLSREAYPFGRWLDNEQFIIALQSHFLNTETRQSLVKLVSNVRSEQVMTSMDDGISQEVSVRKGMKPSSMKENAPLPNPVLLAPWRTFPEVGQPESEFVFRGAEGPKWALFEADGGAWRLQAKRNVATWLAGNCNLKVIL